MIESYLPDAIDLSLVKRVLVIKLRHHGDVLLSSPVFTVLSANIPGASVDALVYADTAPMLQLHPAINHVHVIDRNWKKLGWKSHWQHERELMQTLREQHYDLIVHLTEHARGARLVRRLKPRYSVAQAYPEKRGRWWRNAFTHTYNIPANPRHTVEIHLDALRRIGIYPENKNKHLVLVSGKNADDFADGILKKHNLKKGNYVLVHPTSRWMFKGWSTKNFTDAIRQLHSSGHKIVLTAGPDASEIEVVKKITSSLNDLPIVNLAGNLNLKELSALIARASCFVGLDSVPMHIAAAMNTPCVALFGPSNEMIWGPWLVKNTVISKKYSCRPCGLDGCGNGKVSDCLLAIDSEEVVSAVEEILAPL